MLGIMNHKSCQCASTIEVMKIIILLRTSSVIIEYNAYLHVFKYVEMHASK